MHLPIRAHRSFLRSTALIACLAVAVLVASCSSNDPDATAPPTSLAPPAEVDIPYGPVAGCDGIDGDCGGSQLLDIYRSEEDGPNPVVVWVHGGGFVGGDKSGSLSQYVQPMLDEGWDIVSINYRLSLENGDNAFPTGLLDVKRAVRWVKANAAAQDWDQAAVAAMGISAGGNLVEMLAVTSGDESLEPPAQDLPPELQAVDSSIIGAVALSPVSDMATFQNLEFFSRAAALYLDCTGDCSEQVAAGSVQTHVSPSAAPILAIHGSLDTVAAPSQGTVVQQAYDAAGIGDRFTMIIVEDGPEQDRGHSPDLERWAGDVLDFLDDQRPEPS